jgi:alkylation response protein AidB-like acyl-CoA dehydrogenase
VTILATDLRAIARELEPLILAAEDELENRRRIPDELVDALYDTGVFRAFTPAEVGGLEVDLLDWLELIEELSRLNGSVGWNAFIQAGQTALGPETMRRILADGRYITAGAIGRAGGRALRVEGGYRISGRWPFASGAPYAAHLSGRSLVYDAHDNPVLDPALGGQAQLIAVFPRADVTIHDTWDGLGLRGTQSVDFEVSDRFVPDEFVGETLMSPYRGPLFRGVFFILLGHAAHALGIARCAIDSFVQIVQRAQAKTPHGSTRQRRLGQQQAHRLAIARAESLVQSARLFAWDAARRGWEDAQRNEDVDYHLRVLMAQSMILSAQAAKEAVGMLFEQAGTSAVVRGTPLERCYRDILTAAQHTLVVETSYETIGEYYLTRSLPDGPQVDASLTVILGPPPPRRPVTG